jgi:hypothetical protein
MRLPPAKVVPELRWQLDRLRVAGTPDSMLEAVVLAQRERCKTLKEMAAASRFFFEAPESYDVKAASKHLTKDTAPFVEQSIAALSVRVALGRPRNSPGHPGSGGFRRRHAGQDCPTLARRRFRRNRLTAD